MGELVHGLVLEERVGDSHPVAAREPQQFLAARVAAAHTMQAEAPPIGGRGRRRSRAAHLAVEVPQHDQEVHPRDAAECPLQVAEEGLTSRGLPAVRRVGDDHRGIHRASEPRDQQAVAHGCPLAQAASRGAQEGQADAVGCVAPALPAARSHP